MLLLLLTVKTFMEKERFEVRLTADSDRQERGGRDSGELKEAPLSGLELLSRLEFDQEPAAFCHTSTLGM